jgi:hypothetical protein
MLWTHLLNSFLVGPAKLYIDANYYTFAQPAALEPSHTRHKHRRPNYARTVGLIHKARQEKLVLTALQHCHAYGHERAYTFLDTF